MFPSLPSANNPYVGAASGYASSAGGILNALDAAVNQHAARQQTAKRQADVDATTAAQRDFENQRQMMTEGAVPTQTYGGDSAPIPGRPTLRTAEPNPEAQGEGQQVTDPSGKTWYVPTQGEKDKKSGKTFIPTGGLASALQSGGAWDGKTPISAEQSHSLMMALNEAQPKDEAWDLDTSGKFLDASGKPTAVMIGKKTKTVQALNLGGGAQPSQPGAAQGQDQLPPEGSPLRGTGPSGMTPPANGASPNGPFTFAPTSKADAQQMLEGVSGPKGGKLVWDKNKNTISEVEMPAGSKGTLTAAQAEADKDRHTAQANRAEDKADAASLRDQNRQQADRDRAQKQIDVFQTREQEQHQLVAEYGKVLSQPNTVSKESNQLPVLVVDPKTGRETPMTEERRAYFQGQYNKAKAMADTWHQQGVKLVQRHGGDTGGSPAQTPKPPAAQPVQPAAAPPAKATPQQLSTGHKVGDQVKLKSGKTVKITKINPDGSFVGQ